MLAVARQQPAVLAFEDFEKLADADLLFVEGTAPAAFYRFKHALIQDAAYESLLKNDRQALHRRAAEALVTSKSPQPELVAHHFTRSNQTAPAIDWWGDAGDAALRRSAFQEATSHLRAWRRASGIYAGPIVSGDRAGAGVAGGEGVSSNCSQLLEFGMAQWRPPTSLEKQLS